VCQEQVPRRGVIASLEVKIGIAINGPSGSLILAIKRELPEFRDILLVGVRGVVATSEEQELGPDLGFVRLPANLINSLSSLGLCAGS
jgi:hypothetical protein